MSLEHFIPVLLLSIAPVIMISNAGLIFFLMDVNTAPSPLKLEVRLEHHPLV